MNVSALILYLSKKNTLNKNRNSYLYLRQRLLLLRVVRSRRLCFEAPDSREYYGNRKNEKKTALLMGYS